MKLFKYSLLLALSITAGAQAAAPYIESMAKQMLNKAEKEKNEMIEKGILSATPEFKAKYLDHLQKWEKMGVLPSTAERIRKLKEWALGKGKPEKPSEEKPMPPIIRKQEPKPTPKPEPTPPKPEPTPTPTPAPQPAPLDKKLRKPLIEEEGMVIEELPFPFPKPLPKPEDKEEGMVIEEIPPLQKLKMLEIVEGKVSDPEKEKVFVEKSEISEALTKLAEEMQKQKEKLPKAPEKKLSQELLDQRAQQLIDAINGAPNISMLGILLQEKGYFNPDYQDKFGRTALSIAAEKGLSQVVKLLLSKHQANPNIKDKNGKTPLFWASERGNEEIVEELLKKGANPIHKDNKGITPLDIASTQRIVELFKRYGAEKKLTPIQEAISIVKNAPDRAQLLLESINNHKVYVVAELIKQGLDPKLIDTSLKQAEEVVKSKRFGTKEYNDAQEIVALLKRAKEKSKGIIFKQTQPSLRK